MRTFLLTAIMLFGASILRPVHSQCTTSKLNWDQLDCFYNTGNNVAPYGHNVGGSTTPPTGGYILNAQEMTQRFMVGRMGMTMTTSAAGMIRGENTTHTGELAGYTGADVEVLPSAANQTITITFNSNVSTVEFALYDVDRLQSISFSATNAASVAQNITLTPSSALNLPATGSGTATASVTAVNTNHANTSNNGSVRVSIAGPVRQVVIRVVTVGSDPQFWLSDISACVPSGAFPVNYHQMTADEPFTGQAPYFLVTPDNQSCYLMDTNARVKHLFRDAPYGTSGYINSFAYDQVNHLLYYVAERSNPDTTVKTLKRYNFNTGVIQTIGDIETLLGIPTFDQGIQSGGAAFYDGALYLGVEGGRFLTLDGSNNTTSAVTRKSIVWRIDIPDTTISAFSSYRGYQVWGIPAYNTTDGLSTFHDWGDFLVKDGVLIDFNTARQGSSPFTYPNSAFHYFNMVTGDTTQFSNPNPTLSGGAYAGQAGLDWQGNLWVIRNTLSRLYSGGVIGTPKTITTVSGSIAWVGAAGDASEPFRPKMDFGDAPSTYDPDPRAPAVHDTTSRLYLGSTVDLEWSKTGATSLADMDGGDEDGVPTVHIFNPDYDTYLVEVNVFNNTGANATVCGWLDYNGDNVFDASEGVSVNVPSSASPQSIYLYWPNAPSTLAFGTYTYLRVRVAPAASGMTTANPTGYFGAGEVEDYRVVVNMFPLAAAKIDFTAQYNRAGGVAVNWNTNDDRTVSTYIVEHSADGVHWESVSLNSSRREAGNYGYSTVDAHPFAGISYYRIKQYDDNGKISVTPVKKVQNKAQRFSVTISPVPLREESSVAIYSDAAKTAVLQLVDMKGSLVYSRQINFAEGLTRLPLPVRQLTAGSYVVRLVNGREEVLYQTKVVKP